MGLFDIGKLVDSVGDAVGNAAGAVADTADNAAKAVGDTVGGAASAVSDAAGGAASAVAETAGGATSAAADVVGGAATAMIDTAGGAAAIVGDAAGGAAKAVTDTAGGAATAAMDAAGGAVAVVGDAAGGAVNAVADTAAGAASVVADTAGGAATAVVDTVGGAASAAMETAGNVVDVIESAVGLKEEKTLLPSRVAIPTRDALHLLYYEMSADGKLVDDELIKFREICGDFTDFVPQSDLNALIDDCQAKLDALKGCGDSSNQAKTCIDEVLREAVVYEGDEDSFPTRLALWYMLVIAYSDGECADAERGLVGHVAQVVEEDDSIVLELESSLLTLVDLDREESWVKTNDRPYLATEAVVRDIEARRSAVWDGVRDLIVL